MQLKTLKVRLRSSKTGACAIINAADFDPEKYARLDEPVASVEAQPTPAPLAPVSIEAQPAADSEDVGEAVVDEVRRPRGRRR